ncbi:hypothetical protein [Salinimicrobium oceani]|uniref:Thrombospondin type 3 repeat-containing protein n=1 Tax=Salinimicrobium oceani TaxID=2722702 RepID=A0ABX1CYY2_9FLAO|nr:hypothetical protein [Salinimicrobium oceani]NJW53485.1 hypothetical protein [Salinimicrobium oceani]
MKNFKNYLACLSMFALIFTSCSKDESGVDPTTEKATLSFGAIVADLANNSNKQSDVGDLPACSEAAPSYVEIVLMQGDEYVVGEVEPYRVDLVAGQVFTEEDAALELEPGQYTLEHFAVYDAAGNLTWIAPKGGVLAEFVDSPLPLTIDLGAGVKKYVDVSVLCYDDRDVNQYGYLFFEFDTTRAFEFCFFANYCPPSGRHFPARFSVEFSIDGTVIYEAEENINNVGVNNFGDNFADPICFALPDLAQYGDDEEYLDYTITLLDWEGVYDGPGTVITGSLSRNEVEANFDGPNNVNYEHIRFGCTTTPPPSGDCPAGQDPDGDGICNPNDDCPTVHTDDDDDGDCIPNNDDPCPYDPANECDDNGVGEGCETAYMFGDVELNSLDYPGNNWGWGLVIDADDIAADEDGVWRIPFYAGAGKNDISKGWEAGHVIITLDGNSLDVDFDLNDGVTMNDTHIWVGSDWPESRAPGQFDLGEDSFTVGSAPHYIIVHAEVCGDEED